ncbi:MAG: Beta/Gamma crystallin [Cyanobacteriota bacterium]|jgi:hypothetical protein
MSKINNHGIGINKMNLAIDLQELTCEQAAAIQGGARMILYEHENFQGSFIIAEGSSNNESVSLSGTLLDNEVSSFKVQSGEWSLWSEGDVTGVGLEPFGPGDYSSIADLDSSFNDVISSVLVNIA